MSAYTNGASAEFDDTHVEIAAEIFAMLADPTRIRIVLALREDELSVSQLTEAVDRSQAAVSQHLAKLRGGALVTTRRDGVTVFYGQPDEHVAALVSNLLQHSEHVLYPSPPHHKTTDEAPRL